MKYCKDCKHFRSSRFNYRCEGVAEVVSPIWGPYTPNVDAKDARAEGGECGPEARLFAPRESLLKRLLGRAA